MFNKEQQVYSFAFSFAKTTFTTKSPTISIANQPIF